MYNVELYARVRRACMVEGMSVREASRVFGLHRDTVRKIWPTRYRQGTGARTHPEGPSLSPSPG